MRWSRSLARVRGDGYGESAKLAGLLYDGERVSLMAPRILKGSPEVAIGGVSAPRKALTTAAAGSRVRPLQPEKW